MDSDVMHLQARRTDPLLCSVQLSSEMVERAALRVAEACSEVSEFQRHALRASLLTFVNAINAIAAGQTATGIEQHSWTPDTPALLAGIRRELLSEAQGVGADRHLVQCLLAIENISQLIANDAALRFTNEFAGANALKLLVEVAHDMASPLSAILLLVERLQHGGSGPVTGLQERHLALVYSAAFGLSAMTSDMMELARGGARLSDSDPTVFSIGGVLRAVRDLVQPIAEEKRLTVRFSGPPIDKRIGQPAALSRVLLNLATNAFKFTTVGSVTVLVEQTDDENVLNFSVEDSGRGIPESELTDIFLAFTRSAHSTAPAFSSAGMGLAICHKLVATMGGELRVQSQLNRGSRFSFALRLPTALPTR